MIRKNILFTLMYFLNLFSKNDESIFEIKIYYLVI